MSTIGVVRSGAMPSAPPFEHADRVDRIVSIAMGADTSRRSTTPGSRAEAEALVGAARILVVEDEGSYQDALLVGLTREGYQVEVAADGVTAMQRFIDHPPDLVLLDLLLPGMSGLEVCRRMRAVAPTPIIIVSALNTETDVVLAFELGAEDYISKPYRLRELVARIRSVLRRMALSSQEPPPGVIAPTTGPDAIAAGPFQVNFAATGGDRAGRPDPSVSSGVRPSGSPAVTAGTGADARRAHRQALGWSRPRRYPDPRHARAEASTEVGDGPRPSPVLAHGSGGGFSVRTRGGRGLSGRSPNPRRAMTGVADPLQGDRAAASSEIAACRALPRGLVESGRQSSL